MVSSTLFVGATALGRAGRRAFVDRLVGWRRQALRVMSVPGAFVAVLWYIGANTPSLLPRPWYLQGVVSALCGVGGYVIGVGIGASGNAFIRWSGIHVTMKDSAARVLLTIWHYVLLVVVVSFPYLTVDWQRRTRAYVGFDPPGFGYVWASTLSALVIFAVFIAVWRVIAGVVDWLTIRLRSRILREALARSVASVATLVLVVLFTDQVVIRGALVVFDRRADQVNATEPAGRSAPTSALRSGGPGSSESWASLGQDGAIFVSGGPSRDDIATATKRPSQQPIRVFVGADGGRTLEQNRDAVIAEMDRTGAFGRSAILVVTATSTGYINEWSTSAFEHLGGGDTAVVSMQYSTLPSAIALLSARQEPPKASQLLFDAVSARVAAIPPARRPQLYVGGESLGAFGGDSSFRSPEEMLARLDGAVWTGTPSFSANQALLTARRAPGSTQVNPVVDNGRDFRFASKPGELTQDQYGHQLGQWAFPRVVYLQHDSDPVVWWSTDLLFTSPDWLRETRLGGPMAQMSWLPWVTFWQVSADMAASNTVRGGYGHRYVEEETVPAWAAVLGKDPNGDYHAIQEAIHRGTGG